VCCDLFAFDFDDNTCLEQGRTTLADGDALDTNMLEAYMILDSPIQFTSVAGWKNVCLQHYKRLAAQTITMGTKYLAFCNVCEDVLVVIERSRRNLPALRILYDSTMELLIVKLIVGKAHFWATHLFCDLIREKVRRCCGDVRALCPMGATRFNGATSQKEADMALVPRNRNRCQDWPLIVIEVGVAESLSALKSDAHFWIANSGGLTRVVILIAIDVGQRMIMMERWGHVPPTYPSHVDGPNLQPRMIQFVTIDRNGVVVGAPFDIPSGLIFDAGHIPQGVLTTDFQFNAQDLAAFFGEFWGMLN
jgi:hypothetical protein